VAAAAASRPRPAHRLLETEKRLLLDSPTAARAPPVSQPATRWPISASNEPPDPASSYSGAHSLSPKLVWPLRAWVGGQAQESATLKRER
jgi:hypothetical protein